MKKTYLLSALLVLSALGVYGDDPKGGQVLLESQPAKKEEKKVPVIPPKPAHEILGKRVEYGGYFTDVVRTDKKRSLFDLKAPLDPRKDLDNLIFYPRTENVEVVTFFSIKF